MRAMNQETVFQLLNPLAKTIEESESLIAQMQQACDNLETAIVDERTWQSRYKDAQDSYEMAEYEELAEVIILAQQKAGPLGGIPVSGDGYKIVLFNLKSQLKRGKLAQTWQAAERTRRNYEMAQIDLAQAETRFNSLRKVIDIKTQILRASTI